VESLVTELFSKLGIVPEEGVNRSPQVVQAMVNICVALLNQAKDSIPFVITTRSAGPTWWGLFPINAKETNMPKETTHRDPEKRAERIERRARKRADTASRKRAAKLRKNQPSESI